MENLEKELKKEINETTKKVEIVEKMETTREEEQENNEKKNEISSEINNNNNINALLFCGAITETYCKISDLVYKKIKKASTAPKWDEETKEAIKLYLSESLKEVNLPVNKPYYALLVVVLFAEIQRYTTNPILSNATN